MSSTQATEVILDQVCVTFGQGTDSLAVSRTAVAALRAHYGVAVNDKVIAMWGDIAAQALERVRAAGRLAAQLATARAASAIQPREVIQAAQVVTKMSDTPVCPKIPPTPPPMDAVTAPAADDMDPVMGQVLICFGQGTGTIRVSRAGVAVLRQRYGRRTDVLATWDAIAPQVLERIRAMGRMAAPIAATTRGATVIGAEDVRIATVAVEEMSQTAACPVPAELRAKLEREEALVGALVGRD